MTKRQFEEVMKEFEETCDFIARQCEEEGYPSHGSNYELRVANEIDWMCSYIPGFEEMYYGEVAE